MRHRCKSWSKPIHARKGNSLWARIDNFSKTFVIVRAHFDNTLFYIGEYFFMIPCKMSPYAIFLGEDYEAHLRNQGYSAENDFGFQR